MTNSFYEDQVRRNRLYAQSLLAQGSDTSPVGHPLAAVARAVQGAMGGYIDYKDEQKDKSFQKEANEFYLRQIGGQQSAPTPPAPMSGNAAPMNTPPMGNLPRMNSRVYDQSEFNPMDAQVATQDELGAGVPAPKQYAALIGKAAVDNDLSPQMLAKQIRQESGFNPNAVSSAGATGISQFMPATAREMGVTNPRDPSQAIPAGAQYLRQNIDRFGGSVPLGLAAYNAGPGRVERSGGDISKLPAETQGYVRNITSSPIQQQAQQLAQAPQPAQPPASQTMAVSDMLRSSNPYVMKMGQSLAQGMIAQQMKPQDYDIHHRADGTVVAVNKHNPGDIKTISGDASGMVRFEADKARATAQAKQDVERSGAPEFEAAKEAAKTTAKLQAERAIVKPEQDKQQKQVAGIVTQDIDRALKLADGWTTGSVGNVLAMVPGSDAHDLSKLLDTVKSNAGFQELNKMRQTSPTGAALGSVTERELALLQATVGNLEQSQSKEQFKDNLRRVKNTYLDVIHGDGKGPARERLTFEEKKKEAPNIDDLVKKYGGR